MNSFPLYTDLFQKTTPTDLSGQEKSMFLKKIKKIDAMGYELMYALIRSFQMENSEISNTVKVPYEGRIIKKDMKLDLEKIPNHLKQILYLFLGQHLSSMEEKESRLEKITSK